MKTIFITSFHPLISRNILASPIINLLLGRGNIRLILLVPESKKLFFASEFDHPNIIISGVEKEVTRRNRFFRYLALALIDTRALDIKRQTELGGSGQLVAYFFGNNFLVQSLVRALDRWSSPKDDFDYLFDRYAPGLLFATDVQNEYDVQLAHEARGRGIPVIGMVRSWDNLSSKGMIRVWPNVLLVSNELVKAEALGLNRIPESRMAVVGIPHYDIYLAEKRSGRDKFFKKIGGHPEKKLILYTPVGDRYLKANTVDREIIEIICETMPEDAELLVRLPPTDEVRLGDFKSWDRRIIFDRPKARHFDVRNTELNREADRHLADTLYHCHLVVTGPSTIAVDATLFDKPVILAGFDGKITRPYYDSVRRYFDYEHWRPVLASGGVRLARSSRELKEEIHAYLRNPRRDEAGRKKIAEEQCFRLDGRSSERAALVIYEKL